MMIMENTCADCIYFIQGQGLMHFMFGVKIGTNELHNTLSDAYPLPSTIMFNTRAHIYSYFVITYMAIHKTVTKTNVLSFYSSRNWRERIKQKQWKYTKRKEKHWNIAIFEIVSSMRATYCTFMFNKFYVSISNAITLNTPPIYMEPIIMDTSIWESVSSKMHWR